jgi:hypothetical protein
VKCLKNSHRNFLVLPSQRRPWYYLQISRRTLDFFIKNLLASRHKLLNALIQRLNKFIPIGKLLVFFGYKTGKIDESIKAAIASLKLDSNDIIIRLTTWQRKNNRFSIFIFNGRSEVPVAIAKCLSSQFSNAVKTEFENMQKLSEYFNNTEIFIPDPLKLIENNLHSIYLEKFCEGITLNDLGNRVFSHQKRLSLYVQGLAIVEELLNTFVDSKSIMRTEVYEKYIISSLENFEKASNLVTLYPSNFFKLKQYASKIKNKTLFSIPMHGDLWGGSILLNGCKATLIDWEFFQEQGIPLWDLFMYFLHPGFIIKGHNSGLFSEFCSFYENEIILAKINDIVNKQKGNLDLDFEDIEFLFQTFLIYNCLTRDFSTEKDWGMCLNYYWANHSLWAEN